MRLAGINIPDQKKIEYALRSIYGVGLASAQKIVATAKIDPKKRAKDLTPDEINKIREIIEANHTIEGELRREIMMNIKRLKDLQIYRGTRHARGLPARGQRTKSNSRTRRGNVRRTMGSGRKTAPGPK